MRTRLIWLFAVLCIVGSEGRGGTGRTWRHRRIDAGGVPCQRGCMRCSEINGCLACKPRLFFHLLRRGMRQTGTCRHDCPPGYYGQRGVDTNRCRRCQLQGCERCFSNSFCTRCLPGFLLHRGKCNDVCPRGFDPHNATSECILPANCVVGSWGSWSSCSRLGSTCGYKWGFETRWRLVEHPESQSGRPCPSLRESRRCRMLKRDCQKGDSKHKRKGRTKKQRRRGRHRGRTRSKGRGRGRKGKKRRQPSRIRTS
uniref:R-spondin-2-like n=1 Tax=Myxine glutinosa TaxID=7769 RepID=UPI0035900426